jgi:hypothetical protein
MEQKLGGQQFPIIIIIYELYILMDDRLATDPEIPGSIPGANRFSEK